VTRLSARPSEASLPHTSLPLQLPQPRLLPACLKSRFPEEEEEAAAAAEEEEEEEEEEGQSRYPPPHVTCILLLMGKPQEQVHETSTLTHAQQRT